MNIPFYKRNRTISFRRQLMATMAFGILLLVILSTIINVTFSTKDIRKRLIEEGFQATETLAAQSPLALIFHSSENIEYFATALMAYPDILGLEIYDAGLKSLLTMGEVPYVPEGKDRWPEATRLIHEDERAWYFASTVYSTDSNAATSDSPFSSFVSKREPIGYVRVSMGKQALLVLSKNIFQNSLIVSTTIAALLFLILHYITLHMTSPIKVLAQKMRRAEQGEEKLRVEVGGPRDIVNMQKAFNTMMEVLESRADALTKARDAALESARVKGEFAAHITHELRTPLNGVIGMLELLGHTDLETKQRGYLKIARDSGESLLALINDILDFSRNESGKLRLNPTDFYLQELLDDVVGLLSSQAKKKGLTLAYLVDPAIPPVLYGDADRVRQILINLAGNAVKFTGEGEVIISVTGVETDDGCNLTFSVKDTGIGISDSALIHIFNPFTQEDTSTTREFGGTGLGLTICRQLVEIMGGEITVASEKGKGSTFTFGVPMLKARNKTGAEVGGDATLKGMRALIAATGTANLSMVEQLISVWGISADGVIKAWQIMPALQSAATESRPYQFLIIDETLAQAEGDDFCANIAGEVGLAPLKIVLMVDELPDNAAEIEGVAAYVEKPLRSKQLYGSLLRLVGEPDISGASLEEAFSTSPERLWPDARILVVEDNRANQEVARGILERLGCVVQITANGHEALEAIGARDFDLVFMDCNMPEMDGYEATRRIRALENGERHLTIIAMTANNQQSDAEKCRATGMDDYVAKPIRTEQVAATLAKWLGAGDNESEHSTGTSAVEVREPSAEYTLVPETLNELRDSIGEAFGRMVEVFLEDITEYLQTMRQGADRGDLTVLADVAHTIKGNAVTFGAERLAEACRSLEEACRQRKTRETVALAERVQLEVGAVNQALRREVMPIEEIQLYRDIRNARILVADDDRTMRFGIRNALEREGYQISEAQDGLQALKACKQRMPDLVVLDALMPRADGFDVCAKIRKLPEGERIPILIVTGLEDEHSIGKAYAAGATDYISKPVNYAVLRKRVDRHLYISRAEKYVRHLAYNDSLTGLPNRVQFAERLKASIERARKTRAILAVLFLDLDRFKMVNDTMGHDVGDYLLKVAAERIRECTRSTDMVARLGGDEFTVILDDLRSVNMVANIADKICMGLSRPIDCQGSEVFITTSIGISLYPNDGEDLGALMKHADTAMFCAKESGARYKFYEDGMEMEISKRLSLENDLRRALEREEFIVYYQPQVDLVSGEIVGMEALVRWQHPVRGLVPPNDFIPIAEETGFIEEIGEWVLRTACRQLRTWMALGFGPLRVAVNLSGRQLEKESLIELVSEVLNETGLHSGALELEITESMLMDSDKGVLPILEHLSRIGVVLAIDDFGTGYSSLGKLKRFPIDVLKIDRGFVNDIATNPDDLAIITGIIALAKSLDLKVVAEGVEDAEQEQILKDLKCDIMQGYYFSKPIPASVFEQQFLRQKPGAERDTPKVFPFQRPKDISNK